MEEDPHKAVVVTFGFIALVVVVVFGMVCLTDHMRATFAQENYRQCVADGFGPVCVDILKPSSR